LAGCLCIVKGKSKLIGKEPGLWVFVSLLFFL